MALSGSGANEQIAYWTAAEVLDGDDNLTWDYAAQLLTLDGELEVVDGFMIDSNGYSHAKRLGLRDNVNWNEPTDYVLDVEVVGSDTPDGALYAGLNANWTSGWKTAATVYARSYAASGNPSMRSLNVPAYKSGAGSITTMVNLDIGGWVQDIGTISTLNLIRAMGGITSGKAATISLAELMDVRFDFEDAAVGAARMISVHTPELDTGSITNAYGVHIEQGAVGTGVIGTLYGLRIESIDEGATSYAIYTNEGLVRFGDDVMLADGKKLITDEVRAINGDGLTLLPSTGNGIYVKDGGFVGIGVPNPTQKLHVSGNIMLLSGTCIFTDRVCAINGDGLKLYDDGGAGIFVKDGGNVGIGTVTPAYDLEVAGKALLGERIVPPDDFSVKVLATLALDNKTEVAGSHGRTSLEFQYDGDMKYQLQYLPATSNLFRLYSTDADEYGNPATLMEWHDGEHALRIDTIREVGAGGKYGLKLLDKDGYGWIIKSQTAHIGSGSPPFAAVSVHTDSSGIPWHCLALNQEVQNMAFLYLDGKSDDAAGYEVTLVPEDWVDAEETYRHGFFRAYVRDKSTAEGNLGQHTVWIPFFHMVLSQ